MADLRIVDAPEIPTEDITGEEKLPTGGSGNYSISLDSLADYTKTKKDLVDNTTVDNKVGGVRQELDAHIEDLLNPHQVTKGQIGLGNVDNTADADKPVSNSTQAAIISAVAPKADKTYVDNQLTLKANKTDVYTKQESSDLVNNNISTALTPVNSSLDLAKRGIANRYDSSLTYNSGERVILTNGDVVISTINGNTNNPNSDMAGWVYAELEFYVQHAGAKADFNPSTETGTDNLQAFKDARDQAIACGIKTVRIPSGNYLVNLTELSGIVVNETQDIRFVGDGKESTTIWVDSTAEENVLFNMVGGSAYNTNRGLTGATVRAIPSNKYKGIAYRKNGACFTLLEDFIFQDMFVGDDTVNGIGAGTFCEFNITQNGRLNANKINRRYLVDGGDNSFHGNNVINVQNQVKTGGIGVQVRGSSTTPAYLYNQAWIENYFGGAGCIALSLDNMNSDNLWGNLTHEEALIIESKSDYCQFHFNGNFNGIGSITYDIFNENTKGFGVVVFNNTNSLSGNFTDANLSSYAPSLFQLGQQDRYANGVINTIYSIGEGLGFNCYWTSVGWMFTRNGGSSDIKGVLPSFNISANGQTLKSFNSSYNIVNMNNNGLHVFDDRIQGVVAGMDLGRFDSRFNRLYLNKLDINEDAFVPNIPATYSIGYSSNYVKDIFSLNAVTVVSDVRHKTEVSELTEQELQCAIACGKLYRKYKLNAAVDEKGVNSARYHIGVIAQEVVQCFTDHNLDWRKYGIITYEKWDAIEAIEYQAATYDENGELFTPEIQAIEAREAGEIYMVRYDELNCFINAGIEYRLSRLE